MFTPYLIGINFIFLVLIPFFSDHENFDIAGLYIYYFCLWILASIIYLIFSKPVSGDENTEL